MDPFFMAYTEFWQPAFTTKGRRDSANVGKENVSTVPGGTGSFSASRHLDIQQFYNYENTTKCLDR